MKTGYGILAAGRPYVAAVDEACEAAVIARDQQCGLVVPPGKSGELADALLRLHGDRPLARRMGASARHAALAFDRPVQVQKYYELFGELTARR